MYIYTGLKFVWMEIKSQQHGYPGERALGPFVVSKANMLWPPNKEFITLQAELSFTSYQSVMGRKRPFSTLKLSHNIFHKSVSFISGVPLFFFSLQSEALKFIFNAPEYGWREQKGQTLYSFSLSVLISSCQS